MYNYSIIHLDMDHIDEICEDIRHQYEQKIADLPLFLMALVPEGDPARPGHALDKAAMLCEQYDRFREKLDAMGIPSGILVQCTIGHGYPLNNPFPFQPYIGLFDGRPANICCPYDEGFREHMRGQFATIAARRPALIMVDDDFRLLHYRPGGCGCPLHREALKKRIGREFGVEELREAVYDKCDPAIREAYVDTLRESVLDCAKVYREGIDAVDPTIPGAFCATGSLIYEFSGEIAGLLAGKGNPRILRFGNGHYHPHSIHDFTPHMRIAAAQAALTRDRGLVDVLLAETDTCPQNRYSTAAHYLHSHFTGTILEGASGAKHWLSRKAWEPRSGLAYRKLLAKNAGFYQTLSDLVPRLAWRGCRIPVPARPYCFQPENESVNGWTSCVLERLGLPMYFSAKPTGALFLDGTDDRFFTDEELLQLLSGPVFFSSESAGRLIDRGFGKYLGVSVREWTGKNTSGERIALNSNSCSIQMKRKELVPLSDAVRIHSTVYHIPDGHTMEDLFPGVTSYKNELGGTAVVFCGTPKAAYVYTEAFSFLNESRKLQMASLLAEVGELPLWYTGDAEVYFRAADILDGDGNPTGERFVSFFNIGMDPLEELELGSDRPVTAVEILRPDGKFEAVDFDVTADGFTVHAPAGILDPVILKLK